MKRLFITTFLIITVPFLVFSQNTYIGIRGGLNASWFGGDNWDDYISKSENYFGISISESAAEYATFGLFIENMFSKNIGIASSISYTTYGQDYKYSYSGYRFKGEFSQKAIEILPLLKFSTNYNQGIYALLGPSIQYLVEDFEFEESGAGITVNGNAEPDNKIVLGAVGGFGYGIIIKQSLLKLEVLYGKNITYAFDKINDPFDVYTLQFLVSFGLKI